MNRCATCKYWQAFEDHNGEAFDLGFGRCELAEYNGLTRSKNENVMALAIDAEDYQAALRTRADFGCVQWEEETA